MNSIPKTTPQLYKDCLRLINHVAGKGAKAENMKKLVRNEFVKNKFVKDAAQVELLRSNAVRGLSNYFLQTSGLGDARVKRRMEQQRADVVEELKKGQKT